MAVAVVGTPAGGSSGGNPGVTSLTTSLTLDAAANYLLVPVALGDNLTGQTATTVRWNGTDLAYVATSRVERSLGYAYLSVEWWWLANPATGTYNLVTDLGAAAQQNLQHGIIGLSGAGTAAPTVEGTTSGTANPVTVAATTTAGNITVGVGIFDTATGANVSSNNTQAFELTYSDQLDCLTNAAYDTATSPTMSWASNGHNNAVSVIEVPASAATFIAERNQVISQATNRASTY